VIPTIETIVEDLAAGRITKQEAIGWLNQHAQDAGYCLRDEFAGKAMQGILAANFSVDGASADTDNNAVAQHSYDIADAMLKRREAA
jgi:hypothetical protein